MHLRELYAPFFVFINRVMKRFKELLQEFLDKTLDGFEADLDSLEDPIKFADDKTFEQDFYSVDLGLGEIIKIAEKTNPKIKYSAVKEYLDSKDRHEELGNEVIYAFAVDGTTKITSIGKDNLKYVQTTDNVKLEDFKNQFNLTEYPSPLVIFNGIDIMFGWIESDNQWKMLINKDKY